MLGSQSLMSPPLQIPVNLTSLISFSRQPGIAIAHRGYGRRITRPPGLFQPGERLCGTDIGNSRFERHCSITVHILNLHLPQAFYP